MSNYTYYSEMMREDKETFLKFVNNMIDKHEEYLTFVNNIEDANHQGIYLNFCEIDGDNYGYDVHKWGVDFIPQLDKGIHLNFRGYGTDIFYRLYDNEQEKFLVEDFYENAMTYVHEDEWLQKECEKLVTQEAINARFEWKDIVVDKIKEWTSELKGFTLSFEPFDQWGNIGE